MKLPIKKIILVLCVLFTNSVNAQTNFKFVLSDLTIKSQKDIYHTYSKLESEFIVIESEGKTSSDLYNKVLNYINQVYKNPEEVIVAKTENQFIKISGFVNNLSGIVIKMGKRDIFTPYDIRYNLSYYFKDGRYKVEISSIEQSAGSYGWFYFTGLPTHSEGVENPKMIEVSSTFESYFNSLASDPLLDKYNSTSSSKSDW